MPIELKEELLKVFDEDQILFEEPMNKHTSFRIGGPAKIFAKPKSIEQVLGLKEIIGVQMPIYVLGNGSNVLVDDKGYEGCILQIGELMNQIDVDGNQIRVQGGAKLSKLAATAMRAGLSGLEFASGIPGTVGGAIVMNAGAYGGEMKDVVKEVTLLDNQGNVKVLSNEEMQFGYRNSVAKCKSCIVMEVIFELRPEEVEKIDELQQEYTKRRKEKQPLEFPSAGSTFKRPEGHYAGKLIMDAGLKGYSIGGAEVSVKHCGFIVNKGKATAEDVKALISHIQKVVYEKFEVNLEREVIYLEQK
jgi:UDP-N-acetylmuramate dehydrogenase